MMCHTVATPPLQTLLLDGSANRSEGAHCDPLWIMFFSGIAVHGAEIYRKLKYSYERLSSYKSKIDVYMTSGVYMTPLVM